MPKKSPLQKNLLASMVAATLAPASAWAALDFAQSPPGTVQSYVAPNVILSLDDSGSMDTRDMIGNRRTRTQVLKAAIKEVFSDKTLLPDGKIRLAWQDMWNCSAMNNAGWVAFPYPRYTQYNDGYYHFDYTKKLTPSLAKYKASLAANTSSSAAGPMNAMRVFSGAHRSNFIDYIDHFKACGNTPTHKMAHHADNYMRGPLRWDGPWATEPGKPAGSTAPKYLGCRRNYHILFTDGGWNIDPRSTNPQNFDGTARTLPDGAVYNITSPQTRIYRDPGEIYGVSHGAYTGDPVRSSTTIADWAFKSWADPLQNPASLDGAPKPSPEYLQAPPTETFKNRVSGSTATLEKYWNPRYDPATWPHMVTFTVGFSSAALPLRNYRASNGAVAGNIQSPSGLIPYGYDGNFADYANGTYKWSAHLDRGHDMWHAAINGRGQFYSVEKGEDLAGAFKKIIEQINVEVEAGSGSLAASGESLGRTDTGIYATYYEPQDAWKGWLAGQTIKPDGSSEAAWGGQTSAELLDAQTDLWAKNNRLVLTWNDAANAPVPFLWGNLSATQQDHLNRAFDGAVDGKGQQRLDFIRGDRSQEGVLGAALRPRKSRQGDIINSAVWFTGAPDASYATDNYRAFATSKAARTPMVYVGGNDGMLHGFSAADGSEKLAYVPRAVVPNLARLSDQGYDARHRYFVDGSPMSGDAYDGSQWKTLLVGTLGAGGKGYFVLDVSEPGAFSAGNASTLVVLDQTWHAQEAMDPASAAADIGHIFAAPVRDIINPQRSTQITRLNNGRWAVVMGNGYNSTNQRPVLLIQYLDGARELQRLIASAAVLQPDGDIAPNGLSAPRLHDVNGDGMPDVVYAGDLLGNLWKFDIASASDSLWGVAFGGNPLYTALGSVAPGQARTLAQPITAVPTVRRNTRQKTITSAGITQTVDVGGTMVAFGTGRNVTEDDRSATTVQTLYSVLDNTRYKLGSDGKVHACVSVADAECNIRADQVPETVGSGVGKLAMQRVGADVGSSGGRTFSTLEEVESVQWSSTDGATKDKEKGWYLDFPATGERLLKPMPLYDGSNILAVFSQVPAKGGSSDTAEESCDPAGAPDQERQFLTLINIMDGKRPAAQLLDANGDGVYNHLDAAAARAPVAPGGGSGTPPLLVQDDKIRVEDGSSNPLVVSRMPEIALRPSWRQAK